MSKPYETDHLTDRQAEDIQNLIALCRNRDHSSISYPFDEEGVQHYLLYEKEMSALQSVLAVVPCGAEAECIAFTHPDRRRRGYFTELLELALESFEDCDILFPVSGSSPDTLAALHALGAELVSQEFQMETRFDSACPDSGACSDDSACTLLPVTEAGSDDCNWKLCSTHTASPVLLGTCRTSCVSDSCVCLHHVEILPRFRGRGYGTALLTRLLSSLRQAGICRVILQVSGDNKAALALYEKQGFRITETLSYYLY